MMEREYRVRVTPVVQEPLVAAMSAAVGDEPPPDRRAVPGPGFASVQWFGRSYSFSAKQRLVVATLWNAWVSGTPDVPCRTLLEEAESTCERLKDLFKDHPAWGTLIQRSQLHGGPIGCYRLVKPDEES